MRYAWISLLVVFLDQGSKWLLPFAGGGHTWDLPHFGASLELLQPVSTATDSDNVAANNFTLALLAGMLGIYLLISRWSGQFHFIATKVAVGLQLAGGGISSQVIDLAFRNGAIGTFRISVDNLFRFEAAISDLALFIGLLLLLASLLRGSAKVESRVKLKAANLLPTQLNLLPRGIDNIHIDVHLSPRFQSNIRRVIHGIVPLVIKQLQQGKRQVTIPPKPFAGIQKEFLELMNIALHKGKGSGERQLPDLAFIAVVKVVHEEVNNTVAAILQRTKEGRKEHSIRGLRTNPDDQMVAWLFRFRDHIIALSNITLLTNLYDTRSRVLDSGVRNFLGRKKIFALQAIDAPLLLSESPSCEVIQMHHYLLFGQQQDEPNSFINIDRQLSELFSDYLGLIESSDARGKSPLQQSVARGINSNIIDSLSQPSVLMNPANIRVLLDPSWSEQRLKKIAILKQWRKYREIRQHRRFQYLLREKLKQHLLKSGTAAWIIAAYETRKIQQQTGSDVFVAQLASLLARSQSKHELRHRTVDVLRTSRTPPAEKLLQDAWSRIHNNTEEELNKYLFRFVNDFSRYRRDLLKLLVYQRAATEITILSDAKDIDTSRANFSLYEFLLRSEVKHANAPVLSHIIIKADLRGSTEVTEKLTELDLNPATHFDRNFFSPINAVIESYGAQKVFIEGDAIILILTEHAGEVRDRMIAARACGLAGKIVQIITKQNGELSAYGLPELELGIGIAFHPGPPRYLFDNQHKITISPAINRADRLSACTWSVRTWREKQGVPGGFVEVYQPSDSSSRHNEKAQKELVYNLNGVLIENSVYERLCREVTPQPIHNPLSAIAESTLYTLQFPDLSGNTHNLVIRKAPVHLYDPANAVGNSPTVPEQYFYEVLHDKGLLVKLKQ